jgi:steroid delta-isomerase-like uncharacterized protein
MTTQSTKANKKLAERLNQLVWNDHKTDVIDEIVADRCVMHVGDREFRGTGGYRAFFDTYTNAFPDLSVEINDLIAEDSFVVTTYTARGQHTGALMGIEPTGKQVNVQGVNVSQYRDGKLVESNNLFNEMSLMQQLGVLPEPKAQKAA